MTTDADLITALREDERATRKQWCGRDFDHLPLPDAVGASMKVAAMCHEAEVWALREKIARAAAAPPREPDDAMILAGINYISITVVRQTWRAMWDAAPVAAAPSHAADATREAPDPAGPTPPREPTREMEAAGERYDRNAPRIAGISTATCCGIWRAMYDAAP